MFHFSTFLLFVCICDVLSFSLKPRMLNGIPYREISAEFKIKHMKDGILVKRCVAIGLSTDWMISTAFCLLGSNKIILEALLNKNGIVTVTRYNVPEVVIHPHYNKSTGRHNIGLLRVAGGMHHAPKAWLQKKLIKFCPGPEMKGAVYGWNIKSSTPYLTPPESDRSGYINVRMLSISECRSKFPELDCFYHLEGDYQMCAYPEEEGTADLCASDSGTPLTNRIALRQVGIYTDIFSETTGEEHYCDPNHRHPFVFTQIWPYLPWFSEVTHISYDTLTSNKVI